MMGRTKKADNKNRKYFKGEEIFVKKYYKSVFEVLKQKLLDLPDQEKQKLRKFLDFFLICPVCGNENHAYNLIRFYLDDDTNKVSLKKRVLALINESAQFKSLYENDIAFGIPCCKCFKNIFQ